MRLMSIILTAPVAVGVSSGQTVTPDAHNAMPSLEHFSVDHADKYALAISRTCNPFLSAGLPL